MPLNTSNLIKGAFNKLIQSVVREYLGTGWKINELCPVHANAMHPAVICKGNSGDVFVKEGTNPYSYDQFQKEATGLRHIRESSEVYTPEIYGVVQSGSSTLLIMEAVPVVPVETRRDWEIVGRGLAQLHKVTAEQCGFFQDNYLGILQKTGLYQYLDIHYMQNRKGALYIL